ncbi:MAG: WecB/TagA/CpsF family glycosyltransferase [Candidatus Staskawiczbacteria bacterium]|nr:WecB/TagA/CpsF family glycosyltransferase [Candidatus Staskawiczbacteria bacterium]
MIEIIKEKIKQYKEVILSVFLWLCIWATYNTDISRFFVPGFPHSAIDLIHGFRSLLPFVALVISIIILIKNRAVSKKTFTTPLGLLGIFTIVGIFSSIFSRSPFWALHWGVLYGAVIVVLLAIIGNKDLLKKVIIINLIIAGILAVGLTLFWLIQPGAVRSLTYNFLICGARPYEGLAGVFAATDTFGMAGTRPTGLGRYAGFVAIFALVGFLCAESKVRKKILWFFTFVLFLIILFFSKGKTAIVGFSVAMIFSIWLAKKISIRIFLLACFVTAASIFVVFYNVPCSNQTVVNFLSKFSVGKVDSKPVISPAIKPIISADIKPATTPITKPATTIITKPVTTPITLRTNVVTLSGRTGGVWTDAMHLFLKNPIFGFGFQADRYFLNGQHAHNSIVHALVQAGILGTVPFVLAFVLTFLMLVRLLKNHNIEQKEKNFLVMLSAVLVFFAVRSITESVAFFSADWLFVAPIIAYIQCLDSQVRGSNKKTQLDFYGNKIDLIKTVDVVEKIKYWIKNESQKLHWVIVTGMHGIVEAERHKDFKYVISNANMWVPDGISLVWLAKLKRFDIKERVSGADLMKEFFQVANRDGLSSYFYGDTDETLGALNIELLKKYPNLKIAGSYSPPFRKLTEKEDEEIIQKINQAKPDVLWVALGLPKQERWIFEHREKLNVPVVIGVGAAFKFLGGKVKRAPTWVGRCGFEWLWRLLKEPKVTWKRVFIDMPYFMWLVVKGIFF